MKRFVSALFFISLACFVNAQIRKIPADVTDAFTGRYPHATHVEWKDKLQYFQASFQLNGYMISANFSSKGEWEGSERILTFQMLPTEVKDGFAKSKYAEWDKKIISELQELGKPLQYKISVHKSGLQKKNLFFDVNGKLMKDAMTL